MWVGGDYIFSFNNFVGLNVGVVGSLIYTYVVFIQKQGQAQGASAKDSNHRGQRPPEGEKEPFQTQEELLQSLPSTQPLPASLQEVVVDLQQDKLQQLPFAPASSSGAFGSSH